MVSFDLFIRAVIFLGFLFVEVYKLRNNLVLKNTDYRVSDTPFNQAKFLDFYKKMDRSFFLILVVQTITPYPQIGSYAFLGPIGTVIRIIFFTCFCVSGALYFLSRGQLGSFWAPAGCIKHGQQLIISGLYKYEKHPIYATYFFMMLFSQLTFLSMGVLFPVFAYLRYRALAALEEGVLKREFAEYKQYSRRTRTIFLLN